MTRVDLLGGRKKSLGAIKGDICGEKPWRHVLTLHLLLIVQDKKKKKKVETERLCVRISPNRQNFRRVWSSLQVDRLPRLPLDCKQGPLLHKGPDE